MNKKKSLTNAFVWIILIVCGICVLVRFAIDVSLVWEGAKDLKFYPERVPARDATSEDFHPLWSKKTGKGWGSGKKHFNRNYIPYRSKDASSQKKEKDFKRIGSRSILR